MSDGVYSKLTGYHNRRSIRLPGYDYSQPGYYFVTVCIHDRTQRLFGDIPVGAGSEPALLHETEPAPKVALPEIIRQLKTFSAKKLINHITPSVNSSGNAIITNTLSVMKHRCFSSVNTFGKTRSTGQLKATTILTGKYRNSMWQKEDIQNENPAQRIYLPAPH